MRSIGDLATYMLSNQFHTNLRTAANTAAQEATTGLAKGKVRHLGGSSLAVSLMDRKAQLLETHQRGISHVAIFATATQGALGKIQAQASDLSQSLSLVTQLQDTAQLNALSREAERIFVDTVNALNMDIAGRHVFSGSATDTQPLPSGQALLDMLRNDMAGVTTPAQVIDGIRLWFETPGGGFDTKAYAGSVSGFSQSPIGPDATVTFGLRADAQNIRELLTALGTAALSSEPSFALTAPQTQTVLDHARSTLGSVDQRLTQDRAGVGLIEAAIETARKETDAEIQRLSQNRLSLLGVDQFDAASEFEAAQQQLDVFYRVAARQSRVSLAEYLR